MKQLKRLTAVVLSLFLIACGSGSKPANETAKTEEPVTQPAETKEPEVQAPAQETKYEPVTVLGNEGIEKLLTVYASVMDETFGAEVDWTTPSMQDDIASYYEVKNYASVDEIREYLSVYVDKTLIDASSLNYDFEVKDGKLMAVRGGRGYGYYGIDPTSWKLVGDHVADVQFTILGEPEGDKVMEFTFREDGDNWIVATAQLPEGYN